MAQLKVQWFNHTIVLEQQIDDYYAEFNAFIILSSPTKVSVTPDGKNNDSNIRYVNDF